MVYLNNSEISDLAKKVIQKYREYIGVEWELFKVEPIKLAEMLAFAFNIKKLWNRTLDGRLGVDLFEKEAA